MDLEKTNKVFLLGIGGIGMSALARYFNSIGKKVYGYDKTPSPLTDKLLLEGCEIFFENDTNHLNKELLSDTTLFIFTPAIKHDNSLYSYIEKLGFEWYKRSKILGIISENCFTIAVAGTHGKTTTSSLIAHLLKELNINFTAFLGGIASNFNTNYYRFTDGKDAMENTEIMVVEADEYDRSFLQLSPNISILTSTDADHLDIYKDAKSLESTFQEFLNKTQEGGLQIIHGALNVMGTTDAIYYGDSKIGKTKNNTATYELTGKAPFSFDYNYENLELNNLECGLPGIHNLENTVAAITSILPLTEEVEQIKTALLNYKGVKRRFEVVHKSDTNIVIDDYAHHPKELEKFITSVKMMFPNKKITGIFQPHLYSRTNDFYKEFALSLDLLDKCYLLPIYPARELPMPGVDSSIISQEMLNSSTELINKSKVLDVVKNSKPEVLLIMGAGDIDRLVKPIATIFHD